MNTTRRWITRAKRISPAMSISSIWPKPPLRPDCISTDAAIRAIFLSGLGCWSEPRRLGATMTPATQDGIRAAVERLAGAGEGKMGEAFQGTGSLQSSDRSSALSSHPLNNSVDLRGLTERAWLGQHPAQIEPLRHRGVISSRKNTSRDAALPTPIESTLLSAAKSAGIRHGYFTRDGGVSEGLYRGLNVGLGSHDNREHVQENRRRVAGWFGLPVERLATVHQVHSPDVIAVDANYDGTRPQADAMVTATPGIALGVLAADCGPILFADPENRVVGAAHAGWKGR